MINLGVLDLPEKIKIEISLSKELLIIFGAVGGLLLLAQSEKLTKKTSGLGESKIPFIRPGDPQQELFRAKRTLIMSPEDIATSDDPIVQCLERRGWAPGRISKLQESIAEKMMPDMFGKKQKLSGGEIQLQENIEDCLKAIRRSRTGSRSGQQQTLFGIHRKKKFHFQDFPI